jgi:enoyl-CoA hydratase/carnithine racemase
MAELNVSVADKVATITLSRPERRNAISLAMWQRIPVLLQELEADESVRGVLLAGEGNHFSAGADISEFSKVRANAGQSTAYEVAVDACCDVLFGLRKPTLAAIRGACMGGACNVAMSCDFRFCAPDGFFGIPAARLSIVYGVRGTQRLLALVGLSNAKRIFYCAETCNADEAFRIGLVDRIEADPVEAGKAFLRKTGKNAPLTISGAKHLLNSLAMGLGALEMEEARKLIERASASQDYRESVRAFAEKREPIFQGK